MPRYDALIEVTPQYLPDQSEPESGRWTFAYTIRITNTGDVPSQLISRHWIIEDAEGRRHEVKGLGVVGHQPLLAPRESFEYTSGTPLGTPTGSMRGAFFFVAADGERFEVPIAEFVLRAAGATLH